ncbi:hypothetical protein BDV38DRAFT_292088 [Aspergillus pseudotamarii]|uniref:NmrA-like domain-containing protein n=1 Tax=Aspergillus pseudotamarii TaxID=132259 RepID=A0A5N6TB54_ASPPS|nr:uncharacterized protein BDV38DRAFT_292088 [Aspergillus pseudotamarii]KAE8143497.1 hypothetical protein BDV38DRAFT_292088 [Aspergillus pseudotamarii]
MKTITIVGATGNQGLSVADAFLPLPDWHVRCITRNPSSEKAEKLASLGANIVKADLADIDSLHSAFVNSSVIFVNTDFWGPFSTTGKYDSAYAQEVQHGRNAAMAASTVRTLELFIYSTLAPMKKHSHGKYPHSYHCDAKADIMEYIETQTPELATKTSYIIIGAYATNPLFMPRWDSSIQKYRFMVPLKKHQKMPIIAARESTGAFVKALIDEPPRTRLLAYDSNLSIGGIVEVWSRATGADADLVEVEAQDMHEQLGVPWEVLDAFLFIGEFGYAGGIEGVIHPSQLRTPVRTEPFEEWLQKRNWEEVLQTGSEELNSVAGTAH